MPEYWYSIKPNIAKDDDDEETKRKKDFNYRIAAAKKPYFMVYIYPRLKSEYTKYVRNNNSGAIRRFHKYGINSLTDLEQYEPKTKAMSDYLLYYNRLIPVGRGRCVVNRMAWIFEGVFKKYLSRLNELSKESCTTFDYRMLKGGVVYSRKNYDAIKDLYKEYSRRVAEYQRKIRTEKVDKDSESIERNNFIEYFKSECYRICSNENELCDIVLDLCYCKEGSKQFAWDICGDVILNNLLAKNDYTIHYPQLVDSDGEFTYCGRQFIMCEKKVGEAVDNPE